MNLHSEDIQKAACDVALSIQIAIDPKSDSAARQQAHHFFENFRTKSSPVELCAVGFMLASRPESSVILAGLQLIEYVAKFQWNTLTERQAVKDRVLQLMYDGLKPGSAIWPNFLQEALSKVIVEIAKREWPQLWPNLFPTLFEIASCSDMALLVLRRMAEDVVTLQLIDCSERRKELSQSLNAIAPEVISTLFKVLIAAVQEYKTSQLEPPKRRGKVCLGCLLPYIEWQNPLLFTQETRIPVLYALLQEKDFQIEAADCIIQLLEKKPPKKEDKHFVSKKCLENDCCASYAGSLDNSSENIDYLKKAGNIVTLLAPSVSEGNLDSANFFTCIIKLANLPHAAAALGSACAVNQYFKAVATTTDLTESSVGKALICLLNAICNKFVTGPPSLTEKDDFTRLKAEFSQMLRNVGKRLPKLYKEVNSWLLSSLSSPKAVQIHQWETLVLVVDAVASSVSHEQQEMIDIGLQDLEKCYSKFIEETVLEVKSLILSTVSALFVFLALSKQNGTFGSNHLSFMNSIFESVFQCFGYENVPYARDIRRHAAALMIKLSTKHPDLLALSFEVIHSTVGSIAGKLSSMEYTALMESLLITCNSWNDSTRQRDFISSLLNSADWNEISILSESPGTFVTILQEANFQEKRIIFLKNLTLLYSVIRRVKKVNKPNGILQESHAVENSKAVAFQAATHDFENQHPGYDPVCPLLPVILKLVKTIHSLLDDAKLAFLMELSDQERSHLLGIHFSGGSQTAAGEPIPSSVVGPETEKPHPEKLKLFIQSLLELTYGILGGTPALFTPKFYHIPQVSEAYLSFVGWNNTKLNDFRLRGVIRMVFSPLLINCPPNQYEAVVKPFLQNFCPFMLERLVNRWAVIEGYNTTEGEGEEMEILENTSLRILSKEYIDLIHRLLEMRVVNITNNVTLNNGAETEMNADMEDSNNVGHTSSHSLYEPGECGLLLISDPVCSQPIIHFCIHALCWDDSNVSLKAARCILLSWRKLAENAETVRACFGTVLRALCLWYENEANLDCLFKVIDLIFKNVYEADPILAQMLIDWGANTPDVQRIIALCHGPKNEKKRKDVYRKMVLNNPRLEKNLNPKAQWLRGLPQLTFNKPADKDKNSQDIDLSECFSVIHQA